MYILDGHTPVPCPDLAWWGWWFETADRHVALTEHELFRISTVFLGLDYRYGEGPPLVFESMAFEADSWSAIDCMRYASWDDAEIGHKAMVRRMLEHVAKSAYVETVTENNACSPTPTSTKPSKRSHSPSRSTNRNK